MATRYRIVQKNRIYQNSAARACDIVINGVAKTNGAAAPYAVANEVICAELGRLIGLPIPPSALMRSSDSTEIYFASLSFNFDGEELPPVDPAQVESCFPFLAVGIVVFDIWIANSDRHDENLSVAVDSNLKPVELFVFDHSHALFGGVAGNGQKRLEDLGQKLALSGHCLQRELPSSKHMHAWILRIQQLHDWMIDNAFAAAKGLVTDVEWKTARNILNERRGGLNLIIGNNKEQFPKITDWGLGF